MHSRSFVSAGLLFLLLFCPALYAQWELRTTGLPTRFGSMAIDACDSNTAVVAVGYPYAIYRTTNGGLSWVNLFGSVPDESVWDVSIQDSLHIWAATSGYEVSIGKIFATSDGGKSWQLQYKDSTQCRFMNYVEMFDENRGIAMGDGLYLGSNQFTAPVFPRTTDGGQHWISENDSSLGPSYSTWGDVSFINPDTGFFFATFHTPKGLFKTTDGALSWTNTGLPTTCSVVKFYDANLGLIANLAMPGYDTPAVARTTDGGQTWEVFPGPHKETALDIEFIPGDPSRVWMLDGDQKRMFFSSDTGRTWGITIPFGGTDVVFTDALHGWLVNNNAVYRTVTGGLTDLDETPEVAPESFGLEQNYPNPFNSMTEISYQLSIVSRVRLSVYDILGREVAVLVHGINDAGSYKVRCDASGLSSGTYVYRLQTRSLDAAEDSGCTFTQSRKMLVLK